MNLTKNEIEVMDVFWGVGRPLSRAELLNLSVDKSWQSNSVHILLNNLRRRAHFVRLALHAVEKRTDEPLKRH